MAREGEVVEASDCAARGDAEGRRRRKGRNTGQAVRRERSVGIFLGGEAAVMFCDSARCYL